MSKEKENFNSKNNFKKQEITDNDLETVAGGNVAQNEKTKEYGVFKLIKSFNKYQPPKFL